MNVIDTIADWWSTPSTPATNVKTVLEKTLYAYEAKVGAFMSSGKELYDLRTRVQAYFNVANGLVKSQAVAVNDRVAGLLTEFQAIQASALESAKAASDLRSQMDSLPDWKQLLTIPWDQAGYQARKTYALMVKQASGVVAELTTVNTRINRHLSMMNAARRDVDGLDAYAQGKGVSAKLDVLANYTGSTVKTVAVVAAVALVAAYALPGAIAKARR